LRKGIFVVIKRLILPNDANCTTRRYYLPTAVPLFGRPHFDYAQCGHFDYAQCEVAQKGAGALCQRRAGGALIELQLNGD